MRVIEVGRLLACGLVLGVLLAAPPAAAQSEEELSRARAAFGEGVQLTAEERWPEAASRFREVLAVRATPQVRFNLAVALFHSGELPEAADLLAQVVDADELERRTRREARRMLDEIAPQLAHLTIRLLGDEGGATVILDDREIGLERIGQPMSVMPGAHQVELRRGAAIVARRDVEVAVGESAEVALTTTPREVVDPEIVDRELLVPEQPPVSSGSVAEEWWFWTAIGGGVLVVAGVVIGVAVASSSGNGGELPPVQGNLQPGVLDVMLP